MVLLYDNLLSNTSANNNSSNNNSALGSTNGCPLAQSPGVVIGNVSEDIISKETDDFIYYLKSTIVFPLFFVAAGSSNCLSMIVFYKLGLRERINLCLFALSFVDVLCLSTLVVVYGDSLFSEDAKYGVIYRFMVNHNVVGLYGLTYSSSFVSVIISAERCFCVLMPLRSQRMISTKSMAAFLVSGIALTFSLRFVVTAKYKIACITDACTNKLLCHHSATEYYFRNISWLDLFDGIFYGLLLTVGPSVLVFIAALVTAVKLRQSVAWRRQASSQMWSEKEMALSRMLITLSFAFFVFNSPCVLLRIVPVFVPDFRTGGKFTYTFQTGISMAEMFACARPFVNFLVYYIKGTKYRETLHAMFKTRNMRNNKY